MNWILFGCLAVVAANCDNKEPLCIVADAPPNPVPVKIALKPFDCKQCYMDAIARKFAEPTIWIPTCHKGGWFVKEQYHQAKDESFCVNKYGDEHPNTRVKGQKVDCSKFIDPKPLLKMTQCELDRSIAKKMQKKHIPQCDKNGEFLAVQCFPKDKWCWCAQRDGNAVPKTFFNLGLKKANQPNCDSFRAVKVQCAKDGSIEHPFDCARYTICSPSKVFNCVCPKGQLFDTKLKICNWERNITCKKNKLPWRPVKMSHEYEYWPYWYALV